MESEPTRRSDEVTDALLDAARHVLDQQGPGALTVRAIAQEAGTSTMAVYSRFGGKDAILEALYRRGFEILRRYLAEAPPAESGRAVITELGLGYRRFALVNPALYGFMFERPLPGFDPPMELRQQSLLETFGILVTAVSRFLDEEMNREEDPVMVSYLIWCALHGAMSLELTQAARSPFPGWIPSEPDTAERAYLRLVATVLDGLTSTDRAARHR